MVVATRRVDVEKAVAKRSTTADVHARKAIRTRNLRPDREFGQDGIGNHERALPPGSRGRAPPLRVDSQAKQLPTEALCPDCLGIYCFVDCLAFVPRRQAPLRARSMQSRHARFAAMLLVHRWRLRPWPIGPIHRWTWVETSYLPQNLPAIEGWAYAIAVHPSDGSLVVGGSDGQLRRVIVRAAEKNLP